MSTREKYDTHQKALSLNLDVTIFGSFAEIGAGQEVARWFLRVGGASGTVAKTISAYDKEVSDHLYGVGTRYVSKPRLLAMLNSEWEQLLGQLQASRGADTKLFSFVDTISARNYAGTNDCHGWVGLRFQTQPNGAPNDVILHVNLRDSSNVLQQEAVGVLGVNLIYAAYHTDGSVGEFLARVFEDLGLQRMEIDCVQLKGPTFESWDRNQLHAFLVAGGYAEAVVFPANNQFVPPNELLYKRALVLAPGQFDNMGRLPANLIRDTLAQLPEEELKEATGGLGLFCLSIGGANGGLTEVPAKEIVGHVEALYNLGYGVMLFRARELYTMTAYVNRYTKSRIHFAIGLTVLARVFEDRYKDLAGSLLEGIARLFTQNVRVSVYPMSAEDVQRRVKVAGLRGWTWKETNGMVTAENLHPSGPLDSLYQYLLSSEFILPGKPGKG
ncbi:MAG TPA: hypothetical protein VJP02_16390 [Candidatus Sulfotelmatobacter sp.]|nr:hypothetical protein [Candidatus Sulfotelmatobacter sp.]